MKTLWALLLALCSLLPAPCSFAGDAEARVESRRSRDCAGVTFRRLRNHYGTPKWNFCDDLYAVDNLTLRRLKPELTEYRWEKGRAIYPQLSRASIPGGQFDGNNTRRQWAILNRAGYPVRPLPQYLTDRPTGP